MFADWYNYIKKNNTKISVETPETRMDSIAEDYHGTSVEDPYRWLEDTESEQSGQWIQDQAGFTDDILSKLPGREKFRKRLEEMWDYDKFGIPRKIEGGKLIYSRKTGLQNQSVIYWLEE